MGINGNNVVVNSPPPLAMPLDHGGAFLTPESLMLYCQTRLRGIDEQVNTAFAKQQRANDDSKVLTDLINSAGSLAADVSDPKKASDYMNDLAKKYEDAAAAVSDPTLKDALTEQAKKCRNIAQNNCSNGISAGIYKQNAGDFVSGLQKDVNAGTELEMIKLQSLMSQRQSAVQLVTNLVQALGDQMNKITANIGH